MSRASNTLKASDITTMPIRLRYAFTASADQFSTYGINIISGSESSTDSLRDGSVPQRIINSRLIRQLYYQNYLTGSVLKSASYWNSNEQSTACSGSPEYENRYFRSSQTTGFIAIPPTVFGEQLGRTSVRLSASLNANNIYTYDFADDGNGNLTGSFTDGASISYIGHVGNVIYSQGAIIISANSRFIQNMITSSIMYSTCSFIAETTIYQNEYRCHVSENDFNYTQNPSATKSTTTGSYIDAITGSDFRPYATCVGLYNDRNELLIVGKLSTPYPIPPNTDMTFVVRYDS